MAKIKRPAYDLIDKKKGDDDATPKEAAPKDDDASPKKPIVKLEQENADTIEVTEASFDKGEASSAASLHNSTTSSTSWDSMLYSLLLYKARWGDLNVLSYDSDNTALYNWISEQRTQYKLYHEQGTTTAELTPDRISVLDTIGFVWEIRGDVFWQKHYDNLVAYKEEYGDLKVPRLYTKNPKLGEWVTDQRRQLKAKLDGRPTTMTDERKEKLDAIGFLWKVRERADWNDRYQELVEYKNENGHCVVPQHFAQNRSLGKWVAKQREQFRFYHAGKHSFLTEERIDLLKSLGFVWRVKGKRDLPQDNDEDNAFVDGVSLLDAPKSEVKEQKDEAPEKKRRKTLSKKATKKQKDDVNKKEVTSDVEDDDEESEDGTERSPKDDKKIETDESKLPGIATLPRAGLIPTMNGMGFFNPVPDLAKFGGIQSGHGVPALPSLPTDQQLFLAEQNAVRAAMVENFAARANQQMEFAQKRAMANSQTMADIAAALARQSRFGNGFAGAPGMGMFGAMSGGVLPGGALPGMHLPNSPSEKDT